MGRIIIEIDQEELKEIVQEAVRNVLQGFAVNSNNDSTEDELLNVEEACAFLKMKKATLYQKTHKREIPFMKKGKPLFFSKKDLIEWRLSGKKETIEEAVLRAELEEEHMKIKNQKKR
ncbi:helix-turn-helix domain-containing protein [Niabella sp. CJ426]|uniref:helix-turn-helix domain-containing protein n=1 Tax=Niabella sp. CJ426 TaxID=3393740 RepID=UPI003CFC7EEE